MNKQTQLIIKEAELKLLTDLLDKQTSRLRSEEAEREITVAAFNAKIGAMYENQSHLEMQVRKVQGQMSGLQMEIEHDGFCGMEEPLPPVKRKRRDQVKERLEQPMPKPETSGVEWEEEPTTVKAIPPRGY